MAYDEALADRVRRALGPDLRVTEIRMFGGLCFKVRDHMVCGVLGRDFIARVGADEFAAALKRNHTRPFNFTGRQSTGILYVGQKACSTQRAVTEWVQRCLAFTATLPKKTRARKSSRPPRFPQRKK